MFFHTFIALVALPPSGLPQVSTNADTLTIILNIVFTIIGALSLLFITVGAFKYVVSRGDPQAVAQAKDTILYAVIGLVVSLLAATIINFVIINI